MVQKAFFCDDVSVGATSDHRRNRPNINHNFNLVRIADLITTTPIPYPTAGPQGQLSGSKKGARGAL